MAQKVRELMTSAPVALRSSQPVTEAPRAMRENGTGDVLATSGPRWPASAPSRPMSDPGAHGRDPRP